MVNLQTVSGSFPLKEFSIFKYPAASSLERCADKFPLVKPASRRKKRKSSLETLFDIRNIGLHLSPCKLVECHTAILRNVVATLVACFQEGTTEAVTTN